MVVGARTGARHRFVPRRRLTPVELVRRLIAWPPAVPHRELWLSSAGAALALGGVLLAANSLLGPGLFIAPMGAAAVLLFAMPASPVAQPWPVLGGNTVSAFVGIACWQWLGATPAAVGLAGGLAIGAMLALRCLHPPGGAVAMTAVIGGPAIHDLGFDFATHLVPIEAALLLGAAVVVHKLTGRRYPHAGAAHPHVTADPLPTNRLLAREDLQAALVEQGHAMDIDVDDLESIVTGAQLHAGRRRRGQVLCRDIMSRDVVTVQPQTPLRDAWSLFERHKIKAMPVIDRDDKLVGIVSLHDFFQAAADGPPVASRADRIEQIMTREVRIARPQRPLADIVEAFSNGGLHHLPVLDTHDRVVGMITQSDVVAALFLQARA